MLYRLGVTTWVYRPWAILHRVKLICASHFDWSRAVRYIQKGRVDKTPSDLAPVSALLSHPTNRMASWAEVSLMDFSPLSRWLARHRYCCKLRKQAHAGGSEASSARAVSMKQLLGKELINRHMSSLLESAQLTMELALRWFE
jgi:hypothetical protein